MPAVICHRYDTLPFSEQVRLCLVSKDPVWRAANQPVTMPKPHLVRLTGGYCRIPFMQIGADIRAEPQDRQHMDCQKDVSGFHARAQVCLVGEISLTLTPAMLLRIKWRSE